MTHRRAEPIQLWFKSKAWYVKGFCLIRQDMRLFKLSRVRNLTVTEEQFAERDILSAPPAPAYESRQKSDISLKLKIAPEMTYRVYDEFDGGFAEKQPDGSFVVTVTWPEDGWVYGTILSYGDSVEVLEPEHIRKIIKEKAEKTVKKYLQYDTLLSGYVWYDEEKRGTRTGTLDLTIHHTYLALS